MRYTAVLAERGFDLQQGQVPAPHSIALELTSTAKEPVPSNIIHIILLLLRVALGGSLQHCAPLCALNPLGWAQVCNGYPVGGACPGGERR